MSAKINKSVERIQNALNAQGLELEVVEFSKSTRTAQEAAEAIGCAVSQIAKSLIFRGKKSRKPILVVASGPNRVNKKALLGVIGEEVDMPDANFVREKTGYVIGGVPPVGHLTPIATFIDEDLLKHDQIWAAAGTPNAVFKICPKNLVKVTQGQVICVK